MLRDLCQGRWRLATMAAFDRAPQQRFAALRHALAVNPASLSRTLHDLAALGWIERNEGHGHPLRPDYLLTAEGQRAATMAAQIAAFCQAANVAPATLNRWTLPMMAVMGDRWMRFSEMEAQLVPISAKMLSATIKQSLAAGLIERRLEEAFPPIPRYRLRVGSLIR